MSEADATSTLYQRAGGYDALARCVDAFLTALAGEPQMQRFVAGMNLDRQKRNRQLTLDYLAAQAGGPVLYLGLGMRGAHAGLEVSAADWALARACFERAVAAEIPKAAREELLDLFDSVRSDVVVE